MTWETFYLVCFAVGFLFSVFSFLGGFGRVHLPARFHWLHLPHAAGHHAGALSHGGTAVHDVGASAGHAAPAHVSGTAAAHGQSQISPVNFSTLMAFLAWFGGTGYLLTQYSRLWVLAAFFLATLSGLAGASIVFLFLARVLFAHETALDEADYEMQGVLGKVSVTIRAGGTGEIVFAQGGTRHTAGARSEEGTVISKGTEVVVTRFEKGIAYVRCWEDLTK